MGKDNLTPVSGQLPFADCIDERQKAAFEAQLWQAFRRRCALYTKSESSSVPVSTAEELMTSIRFLLELYLQENNLTKGQLYALQVEKVLPQAQKIVEHKMEQGRQMQVFAYQNLPPVENHSLSDTVVSIGQFFRQYDLRFLAHQIPCDITYQLAHPVDAHLQGIEFILSYLDHLLIENSLLARFARADLLALLKAYCHYDAELVINLYEPAAANCIGLALLGKQVVSLRMGENDLQTLYERLKPFSQEKIDTIFSEAATTVCRQLSLNGEGQREYLFKLAMDLYPRIGAVHSLAGFGGIFTCW